MTAIEYILLAGLILCALAANFTKKPLPTVMIYAAFGTIMATIWLMLKAPDLAITEAAVGVGIDTLLFLTAIRKMRLADRNEAEQENSGLNSGRKQKRDEQE